jgi:predicted Zn-dependent protease
MSIEPYDPCPCGTGKKVKFCCCRDIANDMARAVRALDADQRVAALDQLNRLLARHGDRPALLALKVEAQMGLGDWESVEQTVAALSAAAPDSPTALAQAALTAANRGDCEAAVRSLQQAIEALQ